MTFDDSLLDAEQRLNGLAIRLPSPPTPLGTYVESVQSGELLFLSGTVPMEEGALRFRGRIGENLSIDDGRSAARLAALNALALARAHLGSLDRVRRVIRVAVQLATAHDFSEHPAVAEGASELLAAVFGPDKLSTRVVSGAHSLPLGSCVVVEVLLEINPIAAR